MLARLAAAKRLLREREDSEHEQALIRIGFAVAILILVVLLPVGQVWPDVLPDPGIVVCLFSLVAATAVFADILRSPAPNPVRRYFGMLTDTLGLNLLIGLGGIVYAPLYPVLLWVVLGHGFRFGRRQLLAATILALALFIGAAATNAQWRNQPSLMVASVLGLLVLPAYFAALLGRLHAAIQRAEEANAAKSRFLAMMSHEFRTPLTSIIGIADLLERQRPDRHIRDLTATVGTAARGLLAMVDDLLDLAKIEAGHREIDGQRYDLFAQLHELRGLLGGEATRRGLYLRLRVDPATPWRFASGCRELHQILVNLVANALRFTAAGGITVAVSPATGAGPDPWLRFEVRDTGRGIAPAAQQRIFERFIQDTDAGGDTRDGTGLGLAIVSDLVRLLGGRLGVFSRPGQGACFWVELPLRAAPIDLGEPRHGTVVVAGDRADTVHWRERFRGQGVAVEAAASTQEMERQLGQARRPLLLAVVAAPDGGCAMIPDLPALIARCDGQGVAVVMVGTRSGGHAIGCLADLPADATDTMIHCILAAGLAGPPPATPATTVPYASARRPGRLLVAEDNATNRRVITRLLEQAGHEVVGVADGDAAVAAIEADAFAVVLMDLNMPGLGGLDALKLLQFTHNDGGLPPIVALSADATAATRQACERAGFAAYLTKPVEVEHLLRTIDELQGSGEPATWAPETAPAAHWRTRPSGSPRADEDLDLGQLRRLEAIDSDRAFLGELVDGFIAESAEIMDRLRAAARTGDAAAMRDLAHALRSSAAHLGATRLVTECLALDELEDAALAAAAVQVVSALQDQLDRVGQALLRFVHAPAGP